MPAQETLGTPGPDSATRSLHVLLAGQGTLYRRPEAISEASGPGEGRNEKQGQKSGYGMEERKEVTSAESVVHKVHF